MFFLLANDVTVPCPANRAKGYTGRQPDITSRFYNDSDGLTGNGHVCAEAGDVDRPECRRGRGDRQ